MTTPSTPAESAVSAAPAATGRRERPPQRAGSRLAGILLIVAPAVFLLAEAVTALAWRTPPYNYAYNFVSDLGTTVCGDVYAGRVMCSPLHAVMNTGFIAFGVLFLAAILAAAPLLPWLVRIVTVVLGIVVLVGLTVVATIHGDSANEANGSIALHGIGAQYAIEAANLVGIIYGLCSRRLGLGLGGGVACIALGVFGIACFRALNSGIVAAAVLERGAVYAILVWMLVVAPVLWRHRRRRRH